MSKKKYPREALLKSKAFSHYQQDYLAAILSEDFYTMEEAKKAVKAFFGKEQ